MRETSLLALAVVAGCTDSSSTAPDAAVFGEVCQQKGGTVDINGTFGVLASLTVHIDSLGLVNTDATAELLLILKAQQTGLAVGVAATICDLKLPDVPLAGQAQPIRFVAPQKLLDSLAGLTGTAKLDSNNVCANFTSDPITVLAGAHLAHVDKDPLPMADAQGVFARCIPDVCNPPPVLSGCACDQENDGKPGATLLAQNVPAVPLEEVYVDLRTTFSLNGQAWSSDKIKGEVDAQLQQGILGCGKAGGVACTAGEVNLVSNLNPKITPSTADVSIFRAERVDPTMSCAGLKAARDQLFPR